MATSHHHTVTESSPLGTPQGCYALGDIQTVAGRKVTMVKFLAEGGNAHLYVVEMPQLQRLAVLKRIAAADSEALVVAEREARIMQQLSGHRNVVEFLATETRPLPHGDNQGYEVFILMEYCSAGSLVELLNRRHRKPLEAREIYRIFSQVCQAVAHLHYQSPPILHRDLKPENVLISSDLSRFVLCDFGSCTTGRVPSGTALASRDVTRHEDDIQQHTTLEYRAPELIDLYLKRGLTEKMDIWALGVLLFKLCYRSTPFDDAGELAILNVNYTFPGTPERDSTMKDLIRWMLQEEPAKRPDIYQLTERVFQLLDQPCPTQNRDKRSPRHFAEPTAAPAKPTPAVASAPPPNHHRPSPAPPRSVDDLFAPEPSAAPLEATVTPMRRGRPPRRDPTPAAHSALRNPHLDIFAKPVASPPTPTGPLKATTQRSPAAKPVFDPTLHATLDPFAKMDLARQAREQLASASQASTTLEFSSPVTTFVDHWPSPDDPVFNSGMPIGTASAAPPMEFSNSFVSPSSPKATAPPLRSHPSAKPTPPTRAPGRHSPPKPVKSGLCTTHAQLRQPPSPIHAAPRDSVSDRPDTSPLSPMKATLQYFEAKAHAPTEPAVNLQPFAAKTPVVPPKPARLHADAQPRTAPMRPSLKATVPPTVPTKPRHLAAGHGAIAKPPFIASAQTLTSTSPPPKPPRMRP
ncbi:Ark- serine/threonine protein kinase [Dimargaris xerosporica]|nr:Ark- serine/threonine protein kinase [Dimargaris xerosporica]